jgi:cation diffusion facilitator CzcD-associated flavoprotein CzcO
VVLESQAGFGGTWRTHRYPGIRSRQRPVHLRLPLQALDGQAHRHRAEILAYMGEVIDEHGLAPHIRYRHGIRSAAWSAARRWTVTATRPAADGSDAVEPVQYRARFLWMCQGYYRHSEGYTPTGRAWTTSRAASCIRRPGRTTSIFLASGWW